MQGNGKAYICDRSIMNLVQIALELNILRCIFTILYEVIKNPG
jgi:hypothetical protein